MKKLVLLGFLVGASFTISSCSSSCAADLNAFSAAAQAYSSAIGTANCAQINSTWTTYKNAYNDLCDEQKQLITNWAANESNHAALLTNLGC